MSRTLDALTLGRFRLLYRPLGDDARALRRISEQHSARLYSYTQWVLLMKGARS